MRNTFQFTSANRITCFLLTICLALTACGFQLRGVSNLSFQKLNIQGRNLSISRELKRNIEANNIELTDKAEDAEMFLELLNESNSKRIQSLSGTGVVREFELYYQVSFRTRVASNPIWGNVQTVQLRRDYSYNDEIILGKAEEEARLNNDMHADAVREIIRRLSAVKTTPKQTVETK